MKQVKLPMIHELVSSQYQERIKIICHFDICIFDDKPDIIIFTYNGFGSKKWYLCNGVFSFLSKIIDLKKRRLVNISK